MNCTRAFVFVFFAFKIHKIRWQNFLTRTNLRVIGELTFTIFSRQIEKIRISIIFVSLRFSNVVSLNVLYMLLTFCINTAGFALRHLNVSLIAWCIKSHSCWACLKFRNIKSNFSRKLLLNRCLMCKTKKDLLWLWRVKLRVTNRGTWAHDYFLISFIYIVGRTVFLFVMFDLFSFIISKFSIYCNLFFFKQITFILFFFNRWASVCLLIAANENYLYTIAQTFILTIISIASWFTRVTSIVNAHNFIVLLFILKMGNIRVRLHWKPFGLLSFVKKKLLR